MTEVLGDLAGWKGPNDFSQVRRSSRSLQLSDLLLLYAATSICCWSNRPGNVATRLYRWGERLIRVAGACSLDRRASVSSRPHTANRVQEFSAFRWKVCTPARRAWPPCRGQSYQADRYRRGNLAGGHPDDRLWWTGHNAGSDRCTLAYDLRGAPDQRFVFGRYRLHLSCRKRRGRAAADAGIHRRPGPRRPVLCVEAGDRRWARDRAPHLSVGRHDHDDRRPRGPAFPIRSAEEFRAVH